jgi:hypothetical protein
MLATVAAYPVQYLIWQQVNSRLEDAASVFLPVVFFGLMRVSLESKGVPTLGRFLTGTRLQRLGERPLYVALWRQASVVPLFLIVGMLQVVFLPTAQEATLLGVVFGGVLPLLIVVSFGRWYVQYSRLHDGLLPHDSASKSMVVRQMSDGLTAVLRGW